MARVAMLRLLSEMRFSRSTLQEVTASGWIIAMRFKVFTAENLMVGLAEVRNIWSTEQNGQKVHEGNMEPVSLPVHTSKSGKTPEM